MIDCKCTKDIEPMLCKIVPRAKTPTRETPGAACFDVSMCFHTDEVKSNGGQVVKVVDHGKGRQVNIFSGDRFLIPTGLIMVPPPGYKISVKPRSGLAFNKGLAVINSPGTVDEDYSKETFVLVVNLSDRPIELLEGERIAQIELEPVCTDRVAFDHVDMDTILEYRKNQVRQGGIGSTDK